MGLISHLAEAAGIVVKRVGSLELIASKDVEAFLRIAENRNIAILGIEGFRMDGNRIVPDIDAIGDFSGLPCDDELVSITIEEARRFLLQVSQPEMYFDFEINAVTRTP